MYKLDNIQGTFAVYLINVTREHTMTDNAHQAQPAPFAPHCLSWFAPRLIMQRQKVIIYLRYINTNPPEDIDPIILLDQEEKKFKMKIVHDIPKMDNDTVIEYLSDN